MSQLKLNNNVSHETINSLKLTPQAKCLLKFILRTYGHNKFDRSKFNLELNKHQSDNVIFDKPSKGVVSTTYAFYHKKFFVDSGLIEVYKEVKIDEKDLKIIELQNKIQELEKLISE